MNVFGAISILVAVFGAFLGAVAVASLLPLPEAALKWTVVLLAAVISGYSTLKMYLWLLRKLDDRAKERRQNK